MIGNNANIFRLNQVLSGVPVGSDPCPGRLAQLLVDSVKQLRANYMAE